jgi:hypothetical protein
MALGGNIFSGNGSNVAVQADVSASLITPNIISGWGTPYAVSGVVLKDGVLTLATLPAVAATGVGSAVLCTNCGPTSPTDDTCTSGSGAPATRLGSRWACGGGAPSEPPVTPTLLPPQLLVQWHFDEGTGLPLADATGHGATGTLTGNPAQRTGLTFNGSTQYVTNTALAWPAGQPISVALWVKTAGGTPGGAFNIGGTMERAGAHVPFSDNVLYWDYGEGSTTGRIQTNFVSYLNSWTHVVLVSNGTNFKAIYLNGLLVTSGSVASAPVTALTGVEVGRYKAGAGIAWHTGVIDDFRLYTYVLTATEIDTLYHATLARPATD